jgi:hypothetical protein
LPVGLVPARRAGAGAAGAAGDAVRGREGAGAVLAAGRAELAAIAATQRDPAKHSSALAMIVFGIGAGLRPGELVALRGGDVARHGRRVTVHITGPAARQCRSPRVTPAGRVSWPAAPAAGLYSGPGRAERGYKNFVTNFARGLAADPAAPGLSMRRARSSFICDHLAAGTPLSELLAITGIREAESLARYARHVSGAPSKAALRAWTRASGRADGRLRAGQAGTLADDAAVAFAAELIDRSGKSPVIEAALARTTGRPRPLPARAVLTALLCLALDDRGRCF